MVRTAEAILRNNAIPGNPNLLTRWSQELGRQEHSFGPGESHGQDVSSLATLWMARYLIRLGNETGQGRHWNRALAMLDAILGRLFPLGLMIRPSVRLNDAPRIPHGLAGGAWGLHAMLADTLLDFAGLDYHALDRRVTLEPALPSPWSHVGLEPALPLRRGRLPPRPPDRRHGPPPQPEGAAESPGHAPGRRDLSRADRTRTVAVEPRQPTTRLRPAHRPAHLVAAAPGRGGDRLELDLGLSHGKTPPTRQ